MNDKLVSVIFSEPRSFLLTANHLLYKVDLRCEATAGPTCELRTEGKVKAGIFSSEIKILSRFQKAKGGLKLSSYSLDAPGFRTQESYSDFSDPHGVEPLSLLWGILFHSRHLPKEGLLFAGGKERPFQLDTHQNASSLYVSEKKVIALIPNDQTLNVQISRLNIPLKLSVEPIP